MTMTTGTSRTSRPGAALAYLDGLKNYERSGALEMPSLDRMVALMAELGDPQFRYPVIHLTGTNGKGSTAAMTAALLMGQHLRVGTYTSPHIERVTERIRIDGEPVDQDLLEEALSMVSWAADRGGLTPTWFEAITAAGFWLLADRGVDVAVVEVGMLGRWDATNVVDAAVAVITNVELDHTDLAGPTRTAVATEKAGIIKPGSTLVLGETDPGLRPIFLARHPARILTTGRELAWENREVLAHGSTVDLVNPWGRRSHIPIGMAGAYQCDNALLALTAAEALTGTPLEAGAVATALAGTQLAGRFEIIGTDPTVILDGAHNPAAAVALRGAVQESFPDVPTILLCGALTGRDPRQFLDQVGIGSAELLIATEPASPRALPASILADCARRIGVPAITLPDPEQALAVAIAAAGPRGLVVATGSLYLVDVLRKSALAAATR